MREYEYICKVANESPTKIALITENNELDFRDLVCMLHILERRLADAGVKAGSVVVANTNRAELEILLNLLVGYSGIHVIHADITSVIEAQIDYDFYVGLYPVEQVPIMKTVLVGAEWFAKIDNSAVPELKRVAETPGCFTHVSSGSTGIPKFVRTKSESRLLHLERLNDPDTDSLYINRNDRAMCTLSPITSWAMRSNVFALASGASVVSLSDHRDRILQYIDKYRVSHLTTTPVILRRFLDFSGEYSLLSSLRGIIAGGAYMSRDLLAEFHTKFSIPVRVGYGTSEIGGISGATFLPESDHKDGYIGEYYRQDLEIGFFDEQMRQLPDATEGVVGFKPMSEDVLPEYIGANSAASNNDSLVDGFHFPGDVMRLEGKSLYITGRVKNIINLGGNKISLQAVQAHLESSFQECTFACVAFEGEFEVDVLVVFHDSASPISLDAVNNALKEKFKVLRASDIILIERFSLTPTGKVDVQKLKREYAKG